MFFHAHSLRLVYSMPIQNQFAKLPLRGFEQVKYNTFPVRLTAAPENFPPDQPASGFEESDPARD